MYFSYDFVKRAYQGLVNLDPSDGKSRKEKISGIRYLIATSQLLKQLDASEINLSVDSKALRKQFIDAVGSVVSLNDSGRYSKDFLNEIDEKVDFGVGSNFYTTRLAASRSQDIKYPGRPAHLLFLKNENISILSNVMQTLSQSYGIGNIKIELCIWLLRNTDFKIQNPNIESDQFLKTCEDSLNQIYTSDVAKGLLPTIEDVKNFIAGFEGNVFVTEKQDYSSLSIGASVDLATEQCTSSFAKVLENNLPDDDPIFNQVNQLLVRGAKGILFSGPPGTSKTWYALKSALKMVGGDMSRLERVQFHPSFAYEDFIEGLVSTGSPASAEPMFKPKDKVFLNICNKAREDLDNNYILIIDEFSRGDPSKIFGELLTYIESDYRDIEFRLPYSEKIISIPQNIVIFATMNPYDKSVVDLDSAMERRFEIVELLPKVGILKTLLESNKVESQAIGKIITFFNIANKYAPHGFGHTYFKDVVEEADLILLWNHKLKFIFEKMLRFKSDMFGEVRNAYLEIISDDNKDLIG